MRGSGSEHITTKHRGHFLPRTLAVIWSLLFCGALGLLVSTAALGVERFPPPEFEPGTYTMPGTTTPAARPAWQDALDVLVLVGALGFSVYAVLVKRLRKWILWLMVFSLLYFGFYRKGCICPIGSIQDVTLALAQPGYTVPISVVAFFFLPLLFTLFFGRGFCAAVCPLGAAQDLMVWRPLKLPNWLEQGLGIIPYVYLGLAILFAATGTAFIICEYDPFVAFFRLSGSGKMMAIGTAFLLVGLFVGRPYCRFLCPYGAILSLLSRVSKWNVTLAPADCIKCQICDGACPYNAIADPSEILNAPKQIPWGQMLPLGLLTIGLVVGGGWVGRGLAVPLSQKHPVVSLAEQIAAEDSDKDFVPTDATKAFRQTGKPSSELFAEALRIRKQFETGSLLFGGFAGLVLGIKLIALRLPPNRTIFEPDRSLCVACGRCYTYCPKEIGRVKKLEKSKAGPAKPAGQSS